MKNTLQSRLDGVNVCWIPQAIDTVYSGEVIQSLIRRFDSVEDAPEVLLLSDDRWVPLEYRFCKFAEGLRECGLTVSRAKNYAPLEGLDYRLSMIPPKAGDNPAPGQVAEYRISDGSDGRSVSVILVNAESVEFYLTCLKEWKTKVGAIWCCGYHISFNGCQSDVWWLPCAAKALGTRYVFAYGDDGCLGSCGPGDLDLSLEKFPELANELRGRLELREEISVPGVGRPVAVFGVEG